MKEIYKKYHSLNNIELSLSKSSLPLKEYVEGAIFGFHLPVLPIWVPAATSIQMFHRIAYGNENYKSPNYSSIYIVHVYEELQPSFITCKIFGIIFLFKIFPNVIDRRIYRKIEPVKGLSF